MIKPQELRLGNLVTDSRGKILNILELLESYARVYTIRKDWWSSTSYEEFEPIELTEDWLEKLGFEKTTPDGWLCLNICNDWTFLYWNKGLLELSVNRHSVVLKNVMHVHQLQNLTFALTGEELTIK